MGFRAATNGTAEANCLRTADAIETQSTSDDLLSENATRATVTTAGLVCPLQS